MMIAMMRDQGEKALVSPLSLPKIKKTEDIERFKDGFDRRFLEALSMMELEHLQPGRSELRCGNLHLCTRTYPIVACIRAIPNGNRLQVARVPQQSDLPYMRATPPFSLWLCHACAPGEASYWHKSYLRLAAPDLITVRHTYCGMGYEGVCELIKAEVNAALEKLADEVKLFVLSEHGRKMEPRFDVIK